MSGYKSYSLNRRLQGGGIKIYAVNDISTYKIVQITGEYNECESLFLNANIPNYGELLVGEIYRPPQKSIPLFYEKLDSILDYIGSKRCIIGGDFNINILQSGQLTNNYVDIFTRRGFCNEINIGTYIPPNNQVETSCLDHFLTNVNSSKFSHVIRPALSDHDPILLNLKCKIPTKLKKLRFRNFSHENIIFF